MIVEVRSYRIKPGHRDEFIKLFETRAIPALRSHGMTILGPMVDCEKPWSGSKVITRAHMSNARVNVFMTYSPS